MHTLYFLQVFLLILCLNLGLTSLQCQQSHWNKKYRQCIGAAKFFLTPHPRYIKRKKEIGRRRLMGGKKSTNE